MKRTYELEEGECEDSPTDNKKTCYDDDNVDFVIDKNCVEESEDLFVTCEDSANGDSDWAKNLSLLDESTISIEDKKNRRNGPECFNCSGPHNIKDCKLPRDFKKINEARMKQANRSNNKRYHEEEDDKKPKYKPGRLSSRLRDALNIGPDDIPEWIYRMRKMGFYKGYPPGYLKKAIIKSETLQFHLDSKNLDIPESVNASEMSLKPKPAPVLDQSRVLYYMGFNNTYRALRDNERFQVPPFKLFCEMLQEEININHEKSERQRIFFEAQKSVNNEIIICDSNETSNEIDEDVIFIDKNGDTATAEDLKTPEKPSSPIDNSSLGDSVSSISGTSVVSRRDLNGLWKTKSLPELDKFAVGILPFEANEEICGERGIFKRLIGKIKDYTGIGKPTK